MNLDNYITKVAVNLKQLTKAYNKLVKPRRIKQANFIYNASAGLRESGLSGRHLAAAVSIPRIKNSPPQIRYRINKEAFGRPLNKLKGTPYKQGVIISKGNLAEEYGFTKHKEMTSKMDMPLPSLKTPEAKHMVGKTSGLHEAAELRAGYDKRNVKFMGHIGAGPVLNDLTIANTLTGKGSGEARNFIRAMRGREVGKLEKFSPHLKRLDMTNNRLNRREKRHVEEQIKSRF